jgi:hypothetical protein
MKFEVVKGQKGPNDRVVKIWAYGEVLTFEALLRLLSIIFESENSVYPITQGYQGKAMLLKAIIDVYSGLPIERVLEFYKLNRKGRKTIVIEKAFLDKTIKV